MDRHKQQIKRDRQDLKRRAINSQNKSRMRTLIKNVLSSDSKKAADEYYSIAVSFIDKILLMSNFDGDLPIPSRLKCLILSSKVNISLS